MSHQNLRDLGVIIKGTPGQEDKGKVSRWASRDGVSQAPQQRRHSWRGEGRQGKSQQKMQAPKGESSKAGAQIQFLQPARYDLREEPKLPGWDSGQVWKPHPTPLLGAFRGSSLSHLSHHHLHRQTRKGGVRWKSKHLSKETEMTCYGTLKTTQKIYQK